MAALPPNPALEFSFPIDVAQLPAGGRDYAIAAKAADLKRVASRLRLLELPQLSATLHVAPGPGGLVRVSGRLSADVVQECVVSLVPVPAAIAEEFSLTFARDATPDGADIELHTDEDLPEPMADDTIDLGEVVVEQLALTLDPYPRAPGAVFDPAALPGYEAPEAEVSPFAALVKLKTQNKNK